MVTLLADVGFGLLGLGFELRVILGCESSTVRLEDRSLGGAAEDQETESNFQVDLILDC